MEWVVIALIAVLASQHFYHEYKLIVLLRQQREERTELIDRLMSKNLPDYKLATKQKGESRPANFLQQKVEAPKRTEE